MASTIGPFFDAREAAAFCGYSHSYFCKVVNKYRIRRYGPSRNRFSRAELEAFMANPDQYALAGSRKTRKPISLEV